MVSKDAKLNWTQKTKETNPHLPPCCHVLLWINSESPSVHITPQKSVNQNKLSRILGWNITEDAKNTDLLRARVSATQWQGDGWLDCECAASWCYLLIKLSNLKINYYRNKSSSLTTIFRKHPSATSFIFPNLYRFSREQPEIILWNSWSWFPWLAEVPFFFTNANTLNVIFNNIVYCVKWLKDIICLTKNPTENKPLFSS